MPSAARWDWIRSLIGAAQPDAATDSGGGGSDAGTDSSMPPPTDGKAPPPDAPAQVDAGACATDSDCQGEAASGGACTTGATCDPTWHVCVLTTCAVGACKAAVCDSPSHTCSMPKPYGFEATQFSVQTGGVGAAVTYSIAAAWPFVFVVTTNGVVAYNVVDPTSSAPPAVAVHGIPFIPIATLAVGRRVYFINYGQGGGPSYRQAVAWIDVPQDPLLTDLTAVSAFLTVASPDVVNVLTNGVDGAFVVYGSSAALPTANMHPPLADGMMVSAFANAGLSSGASITTSSGARLLTYRYDGPTQTPNFALVNGAGTSSAQTTAEQAITDYGLVADQSSTGTGGDGSGAVDLGHLRRGRRGCDARHFQRTPDLAARLRRLRQLRHHFPRRSGDVQPDHRCLGRRAAAG